MAEPLFTEDEVEQTSANIMNDPRIMTVLVAPDGTTGKALPQHVDALIQEGYRPLNPNREWEIKPSAFSEYTYTVKGDELPNYIKAGYTTDVLGKFKRDQEAFLEEAKAEQAKVSLNPLEAAIGLGSAAAAGATFGATDLLTRGVNELIGLAKGDDTYAAEASKQLLDIRDQLGGYGIGAEVAGGIVAGLLTGMPNLTGLARVGAMAAEGAASGILSQAGRQALGDEDITASSYLWAAGLGGGLGAGLGGISNMLSKGVGRGGVKSFERVPIDFDDTSLDILRNEAKIDMMPVSIYSNDKLIGTVELSRLGDGYHPGTRSTGVTLEGIQLAKDAPKDSMISIMRELTDNFGSVVSPSKLDGLTPELKDTFSVLGNRHLTREGDPWFAITAESLPRTVSEDTNAVGFIRKALKFLGKMPEEEEQRALEVVNKLFHDDTGLFRKEFVDYKADPAKALGTLFKDFNTVNDMVNQQVSAFNKVKREIGNSLTPEARVAMADEVYQVQRDILRSMMELRKVPTESARMAKSSLQNIVKDLDILVTKNTDPVEAWGNLLAMKSEMGKALERNATKLKAGNMDIKEFNAFKQAYNGVKNILESPTITGAENAELLAELNMKSAISKKTTERFLDAFGVRVKGGYEIDEAKIQAAYKAIREGTRSKKLTILDTFAADMADFSRTVKKAQERGLIQDVELPDTKRILPILDKVNKYREFEETSRVLSNLSAGNFISRALQQAGSTSGAMVGSMLGGPLGGGFGAVAGNIIPSLANDPLAMLKFAQKAAKATGGLVGTADKLSRTLGSVVRNAKPIQRQVILQQLGAKKEEDNKKYIESVRQRVTELSSPSSMAAIDGKLDPHTEAQLKKTASNAYAYVLNNLPKTTKLATVNKTTAAKVDKLLLALVNPKQAMEKVISEGDMELAGHLQAMNPVAYEMIQKKVFSKVSPDDDIPYQKRVQLQKMLGLPYSKTSQEAAALARTVFAAPEKKGKKNPNLTAPELPTGAAIQD